MCANFQIIVTKVNISALAKHKDGKPSMFSCGGEIKGRQQCGNTQHAEYHRLLIRVD